MKKYVSILLVAMLVIACLPFAAFAADTATISGDNVTSEAGATVDVAFYITEATFATYSLTIEYDEDLTLTGLKAGEASPAGFKCNLSNGRFNTAQEADGTYAGTLVIATFQVPADAEPGTVYPVSLRFGEGGQNVSNAKTEALDITFVAGSIIIPEAPHVHAFGKWEVEKEATCTGTGLEVRKCECGEKEYRTIPAKGHTWGEWVEDVAPFCEIEGQYHRVCSACDAKETKTVEALQHEPGDPFTETHKIYDESGNPFDCHDTVIKCKRCGVEISRVHNPEGQDPQPPMGDFTIVLGMVAIIVMMVPCLLVSKFRAVK